MEKFPKKAPKSKLASGGNGSGGLYLSSTDTSEESLLAFMENVANLPGDRYRILDARDKFMRLKTKKNSDLVTAKAVAGTCPDMCPEKERYRRIEECCVSLYEKQDNVLDAKLIVKEYSRSSADQELPLPHELRPPDVLEMTMNHMICNVINQYKEDSSVGEWYDFIWNRTRAIRKDITQQDLCDLCCVSLVEKCARFHIHCAAVLCEEEASIFDPKINNINLTKSLQTLKYLYHDLTLKGITCDNESEFRAYDVLLNLNEGDILRQIQQYPQAVRESPEVKFANKLFSTLNSHNYIRFFRLVRQASYLNACILHRYFSQVRQRALHSIVRAYCTPSHTGQYSLEELVRILAFEGGSEAREFCAWLGLVIDEENNVVLDRSSFSVSGGPPAVVRAVRLIERKRNCSVGEVIHGGPLPPNPLLTYLPHDSFDDSGRLMKESHDASDQGFPAVSKETEPQPSFSFESQYSKSVGIPRTFSVKIEPEQSTEAPSFPEEQREDVTDASDRSDAIREIAAEIVDAIVEYFLPGLARESIVEECIYEEATDILTSITKVLERDVAEEVVEEETEALEREKADLEEKYNQYNAAVTQLKEELISTVLGAEIKLVARSVHNEEREKFLESNARLVLDGVVEEIVGDFSRTVATEIHHTEEKRRVVLRLLKDRTDLARARRYFTRWRLICVKRKKLRDTRRSFPPGPPLIVEKNRIRKPQNFYSSLVSAKRNNHRASNLIDAVLCATLIEEEVSWNPMNVIEVVSQAVKHVHRKKFGLACWKLGIVYPLGNGHVSNVMCQWLTAKFSDDPEKIRDESVEVLKIEHDTKKGVSVSVVAVGNELRSTNLRSVRDSRKLFGLSSLLLTIPLPDSNEELNLELAKMRQHLENVLRAKPSSPPIALQVFLASSKTSTDVSEDALCGPSGLDLNELVAEGLIKAFRINWIEDVESIEASLQLEEGVLWLANNSPTVPELKSSYLKDVVEDGLELFVLDPLHNASAKYVRSPEAVIALYNDAIKHLASVISNPDLEKVSWPAPELCTFDDPSVCNWNSERRLNSLRSAVTKLRLPNYEFEHFLAPEVVPELWTFLESIVCIQDPTVLSRIDRLLRQSSFSEPSIIPWIQIFGVVLQYQISTLTFTSNDGEVDEGSSEPVVFYFEDDFANFHLTSEWMESTRESKYLNTLEEAAESVTSGTKHKLDDTPENEPGSKHPCLSITEEDDEIATFRERAQISLREELLLEERLETMLSTGLPLESPIRPEHFEFHQNDEPPSADVANVDEELQILQAQISEHKEVDRLIEAKLQLLLET